MKDNKRIGVISRANETLLATFDSEGNAVLVAIDSALTADEALTQLIIDNKLQEAINTNKNKKADFLIGDFQYELPIGKPEKIICIGVNYPDRNAEYNDGQIAPPKPSIFIRFLRSFTGHGQNLFRPKASMQLDYEGELVVVIGKGGRHIREEQAYDHLAALSIANEGTIRDWVRHAKFNVTQGKNFDQSGSIGPWLVPFLSPAQVENIEITTTVNGEIRQNDHTGRMIFPIPYLIAYISTFTTLVPGDVILTGTPTGAGARLNPPVWLKPGDRVDVSIEGIGTLSNGISDEV